MNKILDELYGKVASDFLEQWVYQQDSQYKLLKMLYDWKFKPDYPRREVTIICGDLHLGGHTDIYYKNKKAFK